MIQLLLSPFAILIAIPFLPIAPALAFGACYFFGRSARPGRTGVLIAALLWLIYGVYETRMYFWSQTVIAPIRVDLLLIAPVMYAVTALGIWGCVRMRRARRKATAAKE